MPDLAVLPFEMMPAPPDDRDYWRYLFDAGKALETARKNAGDRWCVELNIEVARRNLALAEWDLRGRTGDIELMEEMDA